MNILIKKHEYQGVQVNGVIVVMHCYDGANHLVRKDGPAPVLSFNCQIFNREIIHASSCTCSGRILTWQQATVKETWANIKNLLENYYHETLQVKEYLEKVMKR